MRIKSLSLRRFGHFESYGSKDWADHLVIVYGPNEAGKSTLRAFLTWMLFDFKSHVEARRWGDKDGFYGRLVLSEACEDAVLERDGRSDPRLSGGTSWQLRHSYFGSASRPLFDAVFSFDSSELREPNNLTDPDVQRQLDAAGFVGRGARPKDIVKRLDKLSDMLWRPRARSRHKDLSKELKRLDRELNQARHEARAYADKRREHRALTEELATRKEELAEARRRLHEVGLMIELWPIYQDLERQRAELAGLGNETIIDRATRERIHRLTSDVEARSKQLDEHKDAVGLLATELDTITVDSTVLSRVDELRDLAQRLDGLRHLMPKRGRLQDELNIAQANLHRIFQELGASAPVDELRGIVVTPELRGRADKHVSKTADLATLVPQELEAAEAHFARTKAQLSAARRAFEDVPLDEAIFRVESELLQLGDHIAAREQDRERVGELERRTEAFGATVEGEVEAGVELTEALVDEGVQWAEHWKTEQIAHAQRARVARDRLEQAEAAVEEAQRQRASLPSIASMEPLQAERRRLERALDSVSQLQPAADEASRGVESCRTEAQRLVEHLRTGLTLNQLREVDSSHDAEAKLRDARDELERAQSDLSSAQQARDAAKQAATFAAEPQPIDRDRVRERRERARALRVAWEELRASPSVEAGSTAGGRLLWAALGAFILGAVVAAATRAWAALAALALGGAIVAVFAWIEQRSRSTIRPDRTTAERKLRTAARYFDLDGLPDRATIEAIEADAERDERRLEEHQRHEEQRADRLERLRVAHRTLENKEAVLADTRRAFEAVRSAANVSSDVPTSGVVDWITAARRLRDVDTQKAGYQQVLRQYERAVQALSALLTSVPDAQPLEAAQRLRELENTIAGAEALEKRHAQAEERVLTAQEEETTAKQELQQSVDHSQSMQLADEWQAWRDANGLFGVRPDDQWVRDLREAFKRQRAGQELRRLSDERATLAERIDAFEKQIQRVADALDENVQRGDWRVVRQWKLRLEQARQSRQVRDLRRRELEQAASASEAAEGRRRAAVERQTELRLLETDFSEWRQAVGAGDALAPGQARVYLDSLLELQKTADAVDAVERRLADIDELEATFVRRVAELRPVDVGSVADVEQAESDLRALLEGLEKAKLAAHHRSEIDLKLRTKQAELRRTAEKLDEAQKAMRRALKRHDCESAAQWQSRLERDERRQELAHHVRALESELRGKAGSLLDDASFVGELETGDRVAWLLTRDRLIDGDKELNNTIDETQRHIGGLAHELERLESSADVASKANAVQATLAELRNVERDWARLRIARHLLDTTFERFKRERQPAVLKQASEWLSCSTNGAYKAFEVDEDARRSGFLVVDGTGQQHPADDVSMGAAALLYLCLRLALALDYRDRGVRLPLMLDDVTVHLDPERAGEAMRVIVAAAEEAQVIFFTCRPGTRDELVRIAEETGVDHTLVQLDRYRGLGRPIPRDAPAPVPESEAEEPDRDEAFRAAYEALLQSDEALGRTEILESTGLPDELWGSIQRRFMNDARVVKEGRGRGTRYGVRSG